MNDPYYPAGAIENGRESLRRLVEHYKFTDEEGHLLKMVVEWACLEQAFEYMADYLSARQMDNPLDKVWEKINALGGTYSVGDLESTGYCKAIDDALAIIEDLGGQDPLQVKRDNGQFGVGS